MIFFSVIVGAINLKVIHFLSKKNLINLYYYAFVTQLDRVRPS